MADTTETPLHHLDERAHDGEQEALNQIESHHIDIIPDSDRQGKPRDQFTLWFAENCNPVNFILGGLAIVLGLNLFWAILAIVIGTALGAALTAFHAGQGPKLGVPQMIQSRGQFGFWGTEFLLVASIVLDIGYLALGNVVGGQALNGVYHGVSQPVWIVLISIPTLILGIVGYKWIHNVQKVFTVLLFAVLIYAAIEAFTFGSGIAAADRGTHLSSFPIFVATIAIMFMNMLSWAIFVSDYSRYLPKDTPTGRLFQGIFWGNFLATSLYASLGAFITALIPKDYGSVTALGTVAGSWVLVLLAATGSLSNVLPPYTAMLAATSLFSNNATVMASDLRRRVRVIGLVIVMVIGTVIALLSYHNFFNNIENFLSVLLFLFVPWSAINLVDFYFIKHGDYDVPSFFKVNGTYGAVQWPACICYVIGAAVQIPFVSQEMYTGPLVKHLGGADISWLVGFAVSAVIYYAQAKIRAPKAAGVSIGGKVPAPSAGQ
ncbi:MAG: cytosine permease [Acidimicrobiales bacterium]